MATAIVRQLRRKLETSWLWVLIAILGRLGMAVSKPMPRVKRAQTMMLC